MKKMDKEQFRGKLIELADEKYQMFMSSLLPGIDNILGVRMPLLHKLAREITKGDWCSFLELPEDTVYFEENMLQGLVIGYVKADIDEILRYAESFITKIDNWAVCDSFCSGLKFTITNRERVWSFLQPYLTSSREYDLRFGIVMLLNFYIEDEYIVRVLQVLDDIKHEGYYVKMAAAWAISVCYVKQPGKTMEYLKNNTLDDFTYNKALQKIIESNRVGCETKNMFRGMKRKSREKD